MSTISEIVDRQLLKSDLESSCYLVDNFLKIEHKNIRKLSFQSATTPQNIQAILSTSPRLSTLKLQSEDKHLTENRFFINCCAALDFLSITENKLDLESVFLEFLTEQTKSWLEEPNLILYSKMHEYLLDTD